MFTAYHAHSAEVHFLNTVYGILHRILGLNPGKVTWRMFDAEAKRYSDVMAAFRDTAQSELQDADYVNNFNIFLSCNGALTGNPEHDGCRTLTYFNRSHSEVPLDLKHTLIDMLNGLGVAPEEALNLAASLYRIFEASCFLTSIAWLNN